LRFKYRMEETHEDSPLTEEGEKGTEKESGTRNEVFPSDQVKIISHENTSLKNTINELQKRLKHLESAVPPPTSRPYTPQVSLKDVGKVCLCLCKPLCSTTCRAVVVLVLFFLVGCTLATCAEFVIFERLVVKKPEGFCDYICDRRCYYHGYQSGYCELCKMSNDGDEGFSCDAVEVPKFYTVPWHGIAAALAKVGISVASVWLGLIVLYLPVKMSISAIIRLFRKWQAHRLATTTCCIQGVAGETAPLIQ